VQNASNPNYRGEEILSEIEVNLVKYSNHIVELFLRSINLDDFENKKVLDFGAGQGTLADILRNKTGNSPICAELDPKLVSILESKGFLAHQFLSASEMKFDLIYTSNVLEHIEFDVEALRGLAEKLEITGRLAIYVPAFPLLFSKLDQSVGHFRRYRKKELVSKLDSAGFKVVSKEYSDSVGFIATLFLKLFRFPFKPNAKTSSLMQFYDRVVVPISILLDRIGMKYVFGKNLFVVAQRKSYP
jgi:SAM-dependent methyltransferase